jgi:hypothetical protein
MTQPRTEMACSQCHLPLNLIGDPDHARYIHPLTAAPSDHAPEPVPTAGLHTVARQCDFCGDGYPLWTLAGGDVAAVVLNAAGGGLRQNYGDKWAACATCEQLIRSGKRRALADRAAATLPWASIPQATPRIAKLHEAFLRGLRPGRILITTTAWPAASLQPADLPKVRDRLVQLYQGADTLPDPHNEPEHRRGSAAALERAKLYYVDPDFTDLTERAAAHLPDTTVSDDDAPAADGLILWSRPITDRHLAAASWSRDSDGYHITCYRHIGAGLEQTNLQRVREQVGWLAPTANIHIGSRPEGGPAAALIATWLLIAQHVADTSPAGLDRATRRAYARQQRPMPDLRIVRIKARATRLVRKTAIPGAVGRGPLRQREWVEGHWKHVPHGPGRTLRKLKYIDPYLRGPDDKPIRASTTVRLLGTNRESSPDGDVQAPADTP